MRAGKGGLAGVGERQKEARKKRGYQWRGKCDVLLQVLVLFISQHKMLLYNLYNFSLAVSKLYCFGTLMMLKV